MTGYSLTERLRKTRRRYRLSAASQALYYELVAIANEEGWPGSFKCSNGELETALNVSEKTLIEARNGLLQCGLLAYRSGKGRKAHNDYSFEVAEDKSCKISSDSGSVPGGNNGSYLGSDADGDTSRPIIGKTKSKTQSVCDALVMPTEQQVITFFNDAGYTADAARRAYSHYAGANWRDVNGRRVLNWQQKMKTTWFTAEHRLGYHPHKSAQVVDHSQNLNFFTV